MSTPFNGFVEFLNRCGDAHWDFATAMFAQVGVLVAILLCLDLLLLRRLRAAARYAVWTLMLVKLVLPVSLHSPASVSEYLPDLQPVVSQTSANWGRDVRPRRVPDARDVAANELGDLDDASRNQAIAPVEPLRPTAWVLLAWASVVAFLVVQMVRRIVHVRRIVAGSEAAPDELASELAECAQLAGVRTRRLRLRVSDELPSPAICGFWNATILLPRRLLGKLDPEQIRLVILHELVHWRRCDLQVNLLETVLQIVYFYNPFVWLGNTILRRSREEAVDEAVLVMQGARAEQYSSTLLDIVTFLRRPAQLTLRLLGVVESRKALASRIRRILNRPLPKRAQLGVNGFVAVLFFGVVLLPMARTGGPMQRAEYNVLLSQWKLLGPFPKSANSTGLDDRLVEDEARLSPGEPVTFRDKTYEWLDLDLRSINFRRAFDVFFEAQDNNVGYAWTQFHSDAAGRAVLSLGFNNRVRAWLNGKEVLRNESTETAEWCFLDEALVDVDLQRGTNTLLLKVANDQRAWEAMARILPDGSEKPLLALKVGREFPAGGGSADRIPVIDIELFDAIGMLIGSLKASGHRDEARDLRYIAYGNVRADRIARVRVVCRDPHFVEVDETFAWSEVASGKAVVPLHSATTFSAKLIDAETKEPIRDAVVWHYDLSPPVAVGATGVVRFEDLNPMRHSFWVGAPGYKWTHTRVDWPWPEDLTYELERGGKVLRGIIIDTQGVPLAAAKIQIRAPVWGYPTDFETDESGRFEIVGLPDDLRQIYVIVSKKGYAASRFTQEVTATQNDVSWQLEVGRGR